MRWELALFGSCDPARSKVLTIETASSRHDAPAFRRFADLPARSPMTGVAGLELDCWGPNMAWHQVVGDHPSRVPPLHTYTACLLLSAVLDGGAGPRAG